MHFSTMRFAAVSGALGLAVLAGQQVTIRIPVRLVTMATLVVSKDHRLISDLRPDDFRMLDNGHPQTFKVEFNTAPLSVAIVIQANRDVNRYLPFIAKTGSAFDALLLGEGGEAAVITYSKTVSVIKTFDAGDVESALARMESEDDAQARMLDAGSRAITLLSSRGKPRLRVLLLVGQPVDSGSETDLPTIRRLAEREDILVYAVTLPVLGRAFVSDTLSINGVSHEEKGGFRAGVDLGKLISVMNRSAKAHAGADPASVLTAATGGTQLHVRTQRQFEAAVAAVGTQLRSGYLLTYYPNPAEIGYHEVKIEVSVPGAKVYSRPGYWLSSD